MTLSGLAYLPERPLLGLCTVYRLDARRNKR
jgi:hypothetical protein